MFRGVAQKLLVVVLNKLTNERFPGIAGTLSAKVDKGATGTFQALADNAASEPDAAAAPGDYYFDVSAAETDADTLVFSAVSTNPNALVACLPTRVNPRNVSDGYAGPVKLTVTILALGFGPLPGARVAYTLGVNSFVRTTDVNGQCVFDLDPGTYAISVTKSGYDYVDAAGQDVAASGPVTLLMRANVVTPVEDPALVTGTLVTYDSANAPASGVVLQFMLLDGPGTPGHSYPRDPVNVTSDAGGVLTVGLLPGASYQVRRLTAAGRPGAWENVAVPDTPGEAFSLPENLGRLNG
jgi:hypothetical protein